MFSSILKPHIDFDMSHLIFPAIISIVLVLFGLAIIIRDRKSIMQSVAFWKKTFGNMNKLRFFGTLVATVIYFTLMQAVGDIWPNTGYGFLICSMPFVFATGLLYMGRYRQVPVLIMSVISIVAPTLVWWLFSDVFFLTLP